MTVATTNITSGPYDGNNVADSFSYDFRIDDESQVSVYEKVGSGIPTLLTLTTDYTVAGVGVDGGGIITRVAGALPTGSKWYIRSNYANTQATAFSSQGGFFPDVHESAMDKLTFMVQQLEDRINRAAQMAVFDESAEIADMTIPDQTTRASQYLGFDASGDLITIAGTPGSVTVSSFMETLLDDNTALEGVTTLGLTKGTDVASAATLILGHGNYFDITGTTTITNIPTKEVGKVSILQFDGVLTLTHHATDLILPGGANITTAAGDHAVMVEYDTAKWRCIYYSPVDGNPISISDFLLDEDDMVSDSATKVPSQQSVKAYVDAQTGVEGVDVNGAGTVTTSETTITTLDLGTVTTGERFLVCQTELDGNGWTKGGTAGRCDAFLKKSSGTAVIDFGDASATQICIRENSVAASGFWNTNITGIMRVTTGGTLILKYSGKSIGSDSTIASGRFFITAIKLKDA